MKFGDDLMFMHYPFGNISRGIFTPRKKLYTRLFKLTREDPSKLLVGDSEGNRKIISVIIRQARKERNQHKLMTRDH